MFPFAEIGASTHPCASTYAGPHAFSEPETRVLSSFLADTSRNLIAYITLHSYGQYWLTPWGFTNTLPTDYTNLVSSELPTLFDKRNKISVLFQISQIGSCWYIHVAD